METKETIVSFHHIEALKFLIIDASTVSVVNSSEHNTTIESDLLACNIQLLANADCMLNSWQSLGPTAVDYSKQGAEVYLTVNSSSVYKTNLGSLPPHKKFELKDVISALTFDKEFTKLYAITFSVEPYTVRYFNLLSDELSKPIILNGNPDQITHAVFVREQAILCRTGDEALLLLDSHSGQYSSVNETTATAEKLKIKTLAFHPNKDQSLYAVYEDSTLISLSYNGNHNRQ